MAYGSFWPIAAVYEQGTPGDSSACASAGGRHPRNRPLHLVPRKVQCTA
jgi:hypothetical protein